MKSFILYLLFFIGLATLLYYIYLIIVGKRLAHLMQSKDRYIWNGLRNLQDSAFGKKSTVFLDDSRLIVAKDSLTSVYSKLRSGGLTNAIVIPFDQIVAFDYDQGSRFFLLRFFNRLFKVNNFILKVDYLDPPHGLQRLRFKASSMDPLDFESAFADFNNKIYGDKVLLRSQDNYEGDVIARGQVRETPLYDDDKTTALPVDRLEEAPLLVEDDLEKTTVIPLASMEEPPIIQEEVVEDDLEKTTVLPFMDTTLEESVEDQPVAEDDLEKTTVIPFDSLEEPEQDQPVAQDDLEKTTVIQLDSLDESREIQDSPLLQEEPILEEREELEKTTVMFQEELSARLEEAQTQEPKEDLSDEPVVQRRSFLDRSPRKPKPVQEKASVPAEEKTIAVELPDELKRQDTTGLTEEEKAAQEMERLRKLKEFFSQENSEE